MNASSKKLLCSKCRKRVSYHVHKRPNQYVIKGSEVNYEEYYATCDECTEEIFVPGLASSYRIYPWRLFPYRDEETIPDIFPYHRSRLRSHICFGRRARPAAENLSVRSDKFRRCLGGRFDGMSRIDSETS